MCPNALLYCISRVHFPLADEQKVVCYFSSWAWLRKKEGQFVPENVDPNLCTHVIYAFAMLDPTDLVIRSPDPWTDLDNSKLIAHSRHLCSVLTFISYRILRKNFEFEEFWHWNQSHAWLRWLDGLCRR